MAVDKVRVDLLLTDTIYNIIKDGVKAEEEEDCTKEKARMVINALFDCWYNYVEVDYFKDYSFPVGYKLTEKDKQIIKEIREEYYIKGEEDGNR